MWDKMQREIEVDGKASDTTMFYLKRNIEWARDLFGEKVL